MILGRSVSSAPASLLGPEIPRCTRTTGFISKAMLMKSIENLALPIYYIDGPPAMVNAMRKILSEAGVDDDNIRTEEFSGY